MSGLEVLGALAGTAQIFTYAVEAVVFISEIYDRLKHAPKRIEDSAQQIVRLIELINYIKDNSSLHTPLVLTQLQHTRNQAHSLRQLLDKVLGQYTHPSFRLKYWKVLKGKAEKQIISAVQSLETEKSHLALCLTATHSTILQTQSGILLNVHREVKRDILSSKNSDRDFMAFPPSPPASEAGECEYKPTTDTITAQVKEEISISDNTRKETMGTSSSHLLSKVNHGERSYATTRHPPAEISTNRLTIGKISAKTGGTQNNEFGSSKAAGYVLKREVNIKEVSAEEGGLQNNSGI